MYENIRVPPSPRGVVIVIHIVRSLETNRLGQYPGKS